ncbi:MAG TPA: 4-(cytidine 5'-diphospho)-2-C-methyl-D-erythritol kinase [Burkholderiales bacterium]|nr:4-(cytidine 5'-diphospho)-2-C-methyl-D-erythritol kinase [Burkholderiales bacterium]
MEVTWYPAPGKLNLFLHVLGRRQEGEHAGYHELQTVFRLIERADRIGIAVREDGAIEFSGPFGEDNLCVRAARLLQRETGARAGAEILLKKTLPVGGGLGGGSSDAASVLVVLNRLWETGLKRRALMALGAQLGADVPFFLYGRNALGEGVGEQLTPLALDSAWYLVLVPQVSVSTKETFSSALTQRSKRLKIPPFFPGQGRNDLEVAVVSRYPEVGARLAWLRQRCPLARMTGSGSCVFAEFATRAEAEAIFAQRHGEIDGFVTQGLDRHPLHDWTD